MDGWLTLFDLRLRYHKLLKVMVFVENNTFVIFQNSHVYGHLCNLLPLSTAILGSGSFVTISDQLRLLTVPQRMYSSYSQVTVCYAFGSKLESSQASAAGKKNR